jgi:hypothetical protein
MSPPPRLLIVSPVASHPPAQGNAARLVALAAALMARGVHCAFLHHTAEGMTAAQEAAMRAFWPEFHVNHAERRPEPRLPGAWGLDDWCPETLVARVAALQRARRYDAVLVNYVWLSRAFLGLDGGPNGGADTPGPLRVLDTHDVFGGRRAVAGAAGLDPSWYFTTPAEEARGLARADLVLAIQAAEAATLRARGAPAVLEVGHLPPLPPVLAGPVPAAVPLAPYGVLASGNPWNVAAVRALDAALAQGPTGPAGPAGPASIGPRAAAGGSAAAPAGPAPRWLLAGSILRALDPLVLRTRPLLLPAVADLRAFHDAVGCVLAPNTDGTGLKIKTVEAVLSGRPVLGTAHGFAGLPAAHAAHQAPDIPALVALLRRHAASAAFRAEVALATRRVAFDLAAAVAVQQDALAAAIAARARR